MVAAGGPPLASREGFCGKVRRAPQDRLAGRRSSDVKPTFETGQSRSPSVGVVIGHHIVSARIG